MRPLVILAVQLLMVGTAFGQRRLENIDAFASRPATRKFSPAAQSALNRLTRPGSKVHIEERLGVPTFLWASREIAAPDTRSESTERVEVRTARGYLKKLVVPYRLEASDVENAPVASVHNTGRGAIIVRLRQSVNGFDVFRDEIKVIMNRRLELVALSGYLPSSAVGISSSFRLGQDEAVSAAFRNLTGKGLDVRNLSRASGEGGYLVFNISEAAEQALGVSFSNPARSRPVLFHLPNSLVPGYYVELSVGTDNSADGSLYAYVISAVDGSVLYRQSLTASDSFTYRVWADPNAPFLPQDGPQGTTASPHPTGIPDGFQPSLTLPSLVTLQNSPFSKNDPWLPATATETIGNNVDAYADIASPDGFTPQKGDFRAAVNGVRTFDYTYDPQLPPTSLSQRMASIVQQFFSINFLHDWFYDSGFDEASGNAQMDNFGRGGLGGDRILAEAQDFGDRNNANMSTPADGSPPRMQVYLWDGSQLAYVQVNQPSGIAGQYSAGVAVFGPSAFEITGNLVLVNDGSATPTLGCNSRFANTTQVRNNIAVIDRGTCNFEDKVSNAQRNGAIGVIIVNNVDGGPVAMGATSANGGPRIPVLSLSMNDGALIKNTLAGTTVNSTLFRQPTPDLDGALDNQVVSHEWGHYLGHRLANLGNPLGSSMSEGWSDFVALLMTVREEDSTLAINDNWQGIYPLAAYSGGSEAPQNYYFGLRRVPYSTDFSKDPLTFRHIADGEALPDVPLHVFDPNNSEAHNAGEIWATMLWECYAALLRDTLGNSPRLTFSQAQQRMKDYLVASLKATPSNPTILEGRDALLAVAFANDSADGLLFAQAFARRGAGLGAVAPDRFSTTNTPGLVESFDLGNSLTFAGALLTDNLDSCDPDGSLDNGETGKLTVTLLNNGYGNLTNTMVSVSSSNPNITFPNGNSLSNVASSPFQNVSVEIPVQLSGASGIQVVDFTIEFTDVDLSVVTTPVQFSAAVNYDVVLATSASETVEAPLGLLPWIRTATPDAAKWNRSEISPLDHRWHGPDFTATSLTALVTPVLSVGPGNFSFSFSHRYGFEVSNHTNFDGGVIEISEDGVTWTDIGMSVSPGYNGRLTTSSGNPIGGRRAFVGERALETVNVNLGTKYANKSVRIRFLIGTDEAVGSFGWEIDNVAFTGITNTPFPSVVSDTTSCGP
jgi:large repetitive protein